MTLRKFLNNFEEYFCVWSTAIMTILIFIQVVMRYVFSNSLSWSEEMARFIFLWLSWIGASYAVRERGHFRVMMFVNMIKGRARIYSEYIILIVWFLFCFLLAWYGTKLIMFLHDTGQISAAMQIPMTLPYMSAPVGSVLMCIRLIIEIYKLHRYGVYVPDMQKISEAEK